MIIPPEGDGLSYLLNQQQAVGEARAGRAIVKSLDDKIASLTEAIKEKDE